MNEYTEQAKNHWEDFVENEKDFGRLPTKSSLVAGHNIWDNGRKMSFIWLQSKGYAFHKKDVYTPFNHRVLVTKPESQSQPIVGQVSGSQQWAGSVLWSMEWQKLLIYQFMHMGGQSEVFESCFIPKTNLALVWFNSVKNLG
jgi:hypothetical protein